MPSGACGYLLVYSLGDRQEDILNAIVERMQDGCNRGDLHFIRIALMNLIEKISVHSEQMVNLVDLESYFGGGILSQVESVAPRSARTSQSHLGYQD